MEKIIWLTPLLALIALLFAAYKAHYVSKAAPGNARMQEIASAIAEGANAFLMSEYKILAIFIVVHFALIAVFINIGTAVCFLIGALFSIAAGFCGIKVATRANVRTANAAMESGINKALSITFSSGSVMGMGADLFESYVGELVSALTLGVSAAGLFKGAGAIYPLIIAAFGILASVIATFFVRGKENANPHKALKMGSYVSAGIVALVSILMSYLFFGGIYCALAIIAGLTVSLVIGFMTEVYTSEDYRSVKRIAEQSDHGS